MKKEIVYNKRTVGRPSIPEESKKNHRITVGFDGHEMSVLMSKCKECNLSTQEYIRHAVMGHNSVPSINAKQWEQLSRPLSNLNQIAHNLNLGKTPKKTHLYWVIEKTREEISEVRRMLKGEGIDDSEDQ